MSSPKVWGRFFWTTLHLAALGYPDNPTQDDVATYSTFIKYFGKVLPCKNCTHNYERHIGKFPLANALSNREKLFAWTVDLHNIVSREQHKGEWTYEYAREFYMNGSYNECRLDESQVLKNDIWRMIMILMILVNIVLVVYVVFVLQI